MIKKSYLQVVEYLESLQIMPKTMPGLDKIKRALVQTNWFMKIDPKKVIVVAGTNGKGSTCSQLEALLLAADQKVGFYSSPHLVTTCERFRIYGKNISESDFIKIFEKCEELIRSCELSHFEALTLMAGYFYFSQDEIKDIDYVILEVGLGGTYDATNAFPHQTAVITPIDIDHSNILGSTLLEIAKNKFGIVHSNNVVAFQTLQSELLHLKNNVLENTKSIGIEVEKAHVRVDKTNSEPRYFLKTKWGETELALKGRRGAENAMTALTVFETLGFNPKKYLKALAKTNWPGRMQKINWPGIRCPVYLSGDHNPQGVRSLIEILKDFSWQHLHMIVAVGLDKDVDQMFSEVLILENLKLYLTVTPFKGRKLDQYPKNILSAAEMKNADPIEILNVLAKTATEKDLVVVTGSLYLVGEVLKIKNKF